GGPLVGPVGGFYDAFLLRIASDKPGDFNHDGSVNGDDYAYWRATFGTSNADTDGNSNGIADAADYVIWRKNSAAGAGTSSSAIPEPSGIVLGCSGMLVAFFSRNGRKMMGRG